MNKPRCELCFFFREDIQTGPEMVCALFTDAVTKAQPLKRCISYLEDGEGGGGNG